MADYSTWDWGSLGGDYSNYAPSLLDFYTEPVGGWGDTFTPSPYDIAQLEQNLPSPSIWDTVENTAGSSLGKGILSTLFGVGGNLLSNMGSETEQKATNIKDPELAKLQAQLMTKYPELLSQTQSLYSSSAMNPLAENYFMSQILPLTQTGGLTSQDEYLRRMLEAMGSMGINEMSNFKDYYNQGLSEIDKAIAGVGMNDISPGSRGPEMKAMLEEMANERGGLQMQKASYLAKEADVERQAMQDLLNRQQSAAQLLASLYGGSANVNRAGQLMTALNLPTSMNQARQAEGLNTQKGILGQWQGLPTQGTNLGNVTSTNPWMQAIGTGMTGVGQQFVAQPQSTNSGAQKLADLIKALG